MGNAVEHRAWCCVSDCEGKPAVEDNMISVDTEAVFFQGGGASASTATEPLEHERLLTAKLRSRAQLRDAGAPARRLLLAAARQDDAPGVLQFVADGAEVLDMGDALRLAVHKGCAAVVRELVAVGLSVNESCPQTGLTPLQLACASGDVVVCELLLDALADVHRPACGATALSLARKMGNVEVVEVVERHLASLALAEGGAAQDELAQHRRAHVLPRVSPVLSEAVLSTLPTTPPAREDALPNAGGLDEGLAPECWRSHPHHRLPTPPPEERPPEIQPL